jgi:prepilin-type N-terminal cleavage/methylation domain-containing protein
LRRKKKLSKEEGIEMIRRALKKVHKSQGGFTLIEVLVVMTILGILAAIVSISLLGVTANARTKAKDAEKATVQAAFDAMLSDQQVPAVDIGGYCAATAGPGGSYAGGPTTKDMTNFPGTASGTGASHAYSGPDSTSPSVLATHYLRQATTNYLYGCTANGDIVQTGP